MPYIKVDIDRINGYQTEINSIQNRVKSIENDFASTARRIDWDVRKSGSIQRKIEQVDSSLSDHKKVLSRMNTFLGNTATEYAKIEGYDAPKTATAAVAAATTVVSVTTAVTQRSEIVALAASELGIQAADIQGMLDSGLCKDSDIMEFLEGKATPVNDFISKLNGYLGHTKSTMAMLNDAKQIAFNVKDGYVIVSDFTRKGYLNNMVKWANDGTGIGTRYKLDTLKDTPIMSSLYTFNKVVDTVDKIATGVSLATSAIEAGNKISDVWADDTLSKKEKMVDTAAIAITSAAGMALDVAAPIAGEAVQQTVTAAITGLIPIPIVGTVVGVGVGIVAGEIVEKGIELISDVITSEAVVNQVSETIEKVGDAVVSGAKAVSNAGKKVLESKNVGDAVKNTANLVGTAVVAGAKVVGTAVVETVKVAATVVKETAKKAVTTVKNFFKKW